jgi:hypothetical protein
MIRLPDKYAQNTPERHRKKWEEILLSFMQGDLDRLSAIQRTGSRGRIFFALVDEMLRTLGIPYRAEPVFDAIPPNPWYAKFALEHDITLRTDVLYNPDFFIEDGIWLEVTLSENSAYKRLFKYGHQADRLNVLWLDVDQGFHKTICQGIAFPNAEVGRVDTFYSELKMKGREDLVRKYERLKELKGIIL